MKEYKFLIIHTFGLGDMIMFTPALQKLIEIYPNAKIDFLIFQKIAAEPIKDFSNTNNIYYCDFKIKNILKVLFKVRQNTYDVIITTSGTNPMKAGLFNMFLKSDNKVGEIRKWYHKIFFDKPIKYIENIHRVENNNLLVCNERVNDYKIKFFGVENKKIILNNDRIIIGIHAGSNPKFAKKRWNKKYFVELIDLLKNKYSNLEFIIFSGPNEIDESIYISKKTNSVLIKNRSLKEIAELISQCDIFINTDSGLGHIAGCFDVEVFTVFGPAKDYKAKVYSDKAHVIKLGIECQPCYGTRRLKKCKTFECLTKLTPKIVFEKIVKNSKVLKNAK